MELKHMKARRTGNKRGWKLQGATNSPPQLDNHTAVLMSNLNSSPAKDTVSKLLLRCLNKMWVLTALHGTNCGRNKSNKTWIAAKAQHSFISSWAVEGYFRLKVKLWHLPTSYYNKPQMAAVYWRSLPNFNHSSPALPRGLQLFKNLSWKEQEECLDSRS